MTDIVEVKDKLSGFYSHVAISSGLYLFIIFYSFESWFDIDSFSGTENVVVAEREQNVLSMLHQVSPPQLCGPFGDILVLPKEDLEYKYIFV